MATPSRTRRRSAVREVGRVPDRRVAYARAHLRARSRDPAAVAFCLKLYIEATPTAGLLRSAGPGRLSWSLQERTRKGDDRVPGGEFRDRYGSAPNVTCSCTTQIIRSAHVMGPSCFQANSTEVGRSRTRLITWRLATSRRSDAVRFILRL